MTQPNAQIDGLETAMPDRTKLLEHLATYLTGSDVVAASIGLELGGHALTLAQRYFELREALGISGYMTRDEALKTLRAQAGEPQ